MGDHRLAHRGDRAVERGQHPLGGRRGCGGGRCRTRSAISVRVAKLVALALADVVEADAERRQARAVPTRRAARRSGSSPGRPDSSTPTGTSATIRRSTAVRSASSTASAQSLLVPVGVLGAAAEVRRASSARSRCSPSGSTVIDRRRRRACARPSRIVRGAGTTACQLKVVVQRDRIDLGVDAAAGQQRRQRRGEAQRVADAGEVQRLDPEPVARQHQPAAARARRSRTRTSRRSARRSRSPHRS